MRRRRNKIETALSSLERKVARFVNSIAELDLITRLMQWLASITGSDIGVNPQPKRLLKEMFRQARLGRIQWGPSAYQCPDMYDIAVSQEAWDDYYSRNTSLISRNLEAMLTERIIDDLRCEVSATVTIHLDHTLDAGEYAVEASYRRGESRSPSAPDSVADSSGSDGERNRSAHGKPRGGEAGWTATKTHYDNSLDETQRLDPMQGEATTRGAGPSVEEGTPSGDTPEHNRPAEQNLADDHTPSMAAPQATVSYRDSVFPVKQRSSIGVHRGEGKQADIVLAYCEDLYYVHRLHGTFTYDASRGSWVYHQDGEHGSVLKRRETTTSLQKGDSMALEDADELYLAKAQFPVIFRTNRTA